ncbi:MAG: hydrolase [Planctomycetota bacterium]|jgi:hypothetical protein
MTETVQTGCCPRFDPEAWNERELRWKDKLFVRDRVRSLFHIPLNFGAVMKRNMQRIEAAGAQDPDQIVLSHEASPWGADLYIAVSKEVPGARQERLSGTYFTRVFEGPYSQSRKWCDEMRAHCQAHGRSVETLYSWYTTCPRCAKAYGKNYVVLVARQ